MAKGVTNTVILALLAMLLGLQYALWAGDKNVFDLRHLRLAAKAVKQESKMLSDRNDRLLAEVNDLKSGGEAVESLAREELGFIRQGETFFQVVGD